MRIQQSTFVIILKAWNSIVRSSIPLVLRYFRVETSPGFYAVNPLIGFYM